MCSIRKPRRSLALSLAVLASVSTLSGFGSGCAKQKVLTPSAEPVDTTPLPIDEAMQARDWPRSTVEFRTGGTTAGATRWPYSPSTTGQGASKAIYGPEFSNALMDTGLFVGQTAMLPFTYLFDPPFVKKDYYGVFYEPSYTLMPVLPPDQDPATDAHEPPPAPQPSTEPANEPSVDERASIPATANPNQTPEERGTIPATAATTTNAVPPGETPPQAKPPVIAPGVSEPAPAEPSKEPIAVPPPQSTEPAAPEAKPVEPAPPAPEAPAAPEAQPAEPPPAPEAPPAPEPPPAPPEPNK
jgi:hypothetical protein